MESYEWYKIEKEKTAYIDGYTIDDNNQAIDQEKAWTYDEKTYTYQTPYQTQSFIGGEIDVKSNSKIYLSYYGEKYIDSMAINRTNSIEVEIESEDSNDLIFEYSTEKDDECLNELCTKTLDLSSITPGKYYIYIRVNIYNTPKEQTKIRFENSEVYDITSKKLDNETKDTLINGEDGTKYYCIVRFKDGAVLTTDTFEYKKAENNSTIKDVEEKITDIVANPLTGDNIIYTVIIGLISLTLIVTLTKKLKNS